MRNKLLFLTFILLTVISFKQALAQDEEQVLYFQMEPLNDSLFIKIQQEVFIDPPDPKAEIIVDLRDPNNQTVSIKGALYPYLAFAPETRALIFAYPFKINLEEDIHYGSVFSRVFEKMRFSKVVAPPTAQQISSGMHYVNPFIQIFGGERFGIPIKKDIGFSFGLGTQYSGPLETNFIEARFHILGAYGGAYSGVDAFTLLKTTNNHNNIYATMGYQIGYVIPFGNFFEVSYIEPFERPTKSQIDAFRKYDTLGMKALIIDKSFFNYEFRYPISVLGSTRGKFYVAGYLDEIHVGFSGRELSFSGSTFDLRLDAVVATKLRKPQYVVEVLVQKIAESWAFSAFAFGPSVIFGTTDKNKFGILSIFANMRLKIGTSL